VNPALSPLDLTPEVVALLERRAERLREAPSEEAREAVLPVAEFSLGADHYADPLEQLRSVLPLRLVTPVPLADTRVIGLLRHQGQLITVLSLMALLGVKGWRQDCTVLLLVDAGDGHLVAFDCEHVPRIEALPVRQVEQARSRGKGPVFEVVTNGLRQVGLIDVAALLSTHPEEAHV